MTQEKTSSSDEGLKLQMFKKCSTETAAAALGPLLWPITESPPSVGEPSLDSAPHIA